MKAGEISLRDLRALAVMLREHSLTQAALALNTTQPTISKILAKLRVYFGDPLFIRVGAQMHPTPKALQLSDNLDHLLLKSEELRGPTEPFEPRLSQRVFRLLLTDVGMIHFLPPILSYMEKAAPGVRLLAVPMDTRQLDTKLESGEADIAIGAFPRASRGLRRQYLYADTYVSVARKSHPRIAQLRSRAGFVTERHVAISLSASGHAAHELVARVLEDQIPPENICLRVPSFAAIAAVVMQTEAVGTMPAQLATMIAEELGLAVFPTPLTTPRVEIAQFWHERYQRDCGHKWMRTVIADLFRAGGRRPNMSTVGEEIVAA